MRTNTIHGIDPSSPTFAADLIAFHRRTFGDTRMEEAPAAPGPAPAAPAAPAPAAPAPAPSAPAPAPAPQEPTAPAQKVEDLPEWAQTLIKNTRQEAAGNRTKLTAAEQQQQDIVKAFAKAAGIALPDDAAEAPDPTKLAEQLTAEQTRARQAQIDLAVYQTATKHQGDPVALLDSRTFQAKVVALDPTAGDFQTKVDAAIKEAVDANPKLKAGRAPGASSVDHAGGTGEQTQRTVKPLDQAVAGAYGPQ